jgi:hypothetical protein
MNEEIITLQDVLARVVPFAETDPDHRRSPALDKLEEHLSTGTYLGWNEKFEERVVSVAINEWLCTDTMVGVYAIYMDGKFVALSMQSARKNYVDYYWQSQADADAMRKFIRSLSDQDDPLVVNLIKPEKTFPAWWLQPSKTVVREGRRTVLPPHLVAWEESDENE